MAMIPGIEALQRGRAEGQDGPPAPMAAGPGDAMIEKLAGLEAKLDKILELLGAGQSGQARGDVTGEAPHDDGY